MKLLLIADDGQILDTSDEFTRDELDGLSPMGAHMLIADMNAGPR